MKNFLKRFGFISRDDIIRILGKRYAELLESADFNEANEDFGLAACYRDQASEVHWIARCFCVGYEVLQEASKHYDINRYE